MNNAKRVMSFAIVVILSLCVSMQTQAKGMDSLSEVNSSYTDSSILDLGLKYFPEYRNKLLKVDCQKTPDQYENVKISYTCSRDIDDLSRITYFETTKGVTGLVYHKQWQNTTSSPAYGETGTTYTSTLMVWVTGCIGTINVSGFSYTIYNNSFDRINNVGILLDNAGIGAAIIRKQYETSTGPAYAEYAGNLSDMYWQHDVPIGVEIRVGGNSVIVLVNNTVV